MFTWAGDRRLALRVAGHGPFPGLRLLHRHGRRHVQNSHPDVHLRVVRPEAVQRRGGSRAVLQGRLQSLQRDV